MATVTKEHCEQKRTTLRVYAAKALVEPAIMFSATPSNETVTNPSDGNSYAIVEYSGSLTATATNSNGTNSELSVSVNDGAATTGTASVEKTLATGEDGYYTITATVTKDYTTQKTATRRVYAVKALDAPTISITGTTYNEVDSDGYKYYEVSSGGTVSYTISSESGTTISGTAGTSYSTAGAATTNEKTGTLGIGTYEITATAHKENTNDSSTTTQKIKVVQALAEPTISYSAYDSYDRTVTSGGNNYPVME